MPEFLEDPSVLTKEKLKSELVANNVTLPVGEQRKDVYVQLYLQHLTARNRPPLAAGANSKGPPDFSSDEEREPTPVLGSGAAFSGRSRAAVGRVRNARPGPQRRAVGGCRPYPPPRPARARSPPSLAPPRASLAAGLSPRRTSRLACGSADAGFGSLTAGLQTLEWEAAGGERREVGAAGLAVVCLEGVKLAFALLWRANSLVFLDRREWGFRCRIRKHSKGGQPEIVVGYIRAFSRFIN